MFNQQIFTEMLSEMSKINEDVDNYTYILCRKGCTDVECDVYQEMLDVALLQKEQIGIILDDYVSLNVGIKDATNLLCRV